MPSPVICIRDADISNGQLLVKDMWPNRSQANPSIDPAPQGPRYLRVVENVLPTLTGTVIAQTVSGLSAYLLVTIDQDGGGNNDANITPAQSKTMADALIAEMRAGNDLDLAGMNAVLGAIVGGTGVTTGSSTATVNNILQILSGATFTLGAGHDLEDANNVPQFMSEDDQASSFSAFHNPIVEEDSSFWISLAQGDLSGLKSYRTVNGVLVAPYVVVYSGTGVAQ